MHMHGRLGWIDITKTATYMVLSGQDFPNTSTQATGITKRNYPALTAGETSLADVKATSQLHTGSLILTLLLCVFCPSPLHCTAAHMVKQTTTTPGAAYYESKIWATGAGHCVQPSQIKKRQACGHERAL